MTYLLDYSLSRIHPPCLKKLLSFSEALQTTSVTPAVLNWINYWISQDVFNLKQIFKSYLHVFSTAADSIKLSPKMYHVVRHGHKQNFTGNSKVFDDARLY